MEVLAENGVEFQNLKHKYLTVLKDVAVGLEDTAVMYKDDVIRVKSRYYDNTDYCIADIYCRKQKKVVRIIIINANRRFRYSYKNEVKNVCIP